MIILAWNSMGKAIAFLCTLHVALLLHKATLRMLELKESRTKRAIVC